jgi:hypothetical protein
LHPPRRLAHLKGAYGSKEIEMATIEEIHAAADEQRLGFMENTVHLTRDQLLRQMETLGECKMEDESREGQIVTQRCINFVDAVGAFKYPSTWAEAKRDHFQGPLCDIRDLQDKLREEIAASGDC